MTGYSGENIAVWLTLCAGEFDLTFRLTLYVFALGILLVAKVSTVGIMTHLISYLVD